ncbi:potassium channel family protein [Beggiatoa leptomitoformis]|uniref:Potassium transporter TrkA n=1 Tax=Beggiatoa leptomitoformis TaxID=288004 RepID=A0A2N9YAG0_9GAMM|nr:NAD-binding protein [Beggiatoa leptomitoformis]ALG67137.1 potassium transporter TrkA [Beggiatoa leptomitoformis]AUI67463.1 potassium transporter TrkA [Beggiatoa leptomitoformis]
MNNVIFLIMRRMRAPLLVLISVYAVSVIGMTLMLGIDSNGNVWYMNFYQAFYFVSYTATTIGFGEVPYAFSDAQRLWAMIVIYLTVIGWLYAIGALLSLLQDESLRRVLIEHRFSKTIRRLREPFYLVCGYGDTGKALVHALETRSIRSVVIELEQSHLDELSLENFAVYVPHLCADASKPYYLQEAGIKHPYCAGVVAITNNNLVNLHIAITAKLLNPAITVICRVEDQKVAANMTSFGTDYVINPFEVFARQLQTTLHAPTLHILQQWFTGKWQKNLMTDLKLPRQGLWVLCGYGRFGKAVYQELKDEPIQLVTVEATPSEMGAPKGEYVIGRGTEADTLKEANIEQAVGLVAGTNDDVDNLSIVMTARELNPNLFIVLRQNLADNAIIFEAAHADIVMQPSKIIADYIWILLTTPLLELFMTLAEQEDETWLIALLERLQQTVATSQPILWEVTINAKATPAIINAIQAGRTPTLQHLISRPRERSERLKTVALLCQRETETLLLPTDNLPLQLNDRLLFCGTQSAVKWMSWNLKDDFVLYYLLTGNIPSRSYLGRWWQKGV